MMSAGLHLIDRSSLESHVPPDHWNTRTQEFVHMPDRIRLQFCQMEPNGGAKVHAHDAEDQIFFVITGTLTVTGEDEEQICVSPEHALLIKARSLHGTVNNGTEPCRYMVMTVPGSSPRNGAQPT